MIQSIDAIFDFNRTLLGVAQPDELRILTDAESEYALRCLVEEANELGTASSIVDQVDALVDTLYYSVGHAYRIGCKSSHLDDHIALEVIDTPQTHMNIQPRVLRKLSSAEIQAISDKIYQNAANLRASTLIVPQLDYVVSTIAESLRALYKMGLTPEQAQQCILAVDEANKKKKRGVNARRDLGVEDAVKPENWVGPEVAIATILDLDAGGAA